MGFFKRNGGQGVTEATRAAGSGLAAVLPENPKPWYRTAHLIQLNLILLVPLMSSASVGYDGKS
ncbi:uncharacterized protein E0L32_001674 [Thyridium curvatum]|uniref:Uncharacterized protein n=1 Tax=Thyridium curvatum TaxID=1093900 RepID=A0A507ARR4_9PEZI|nr:uncharacterized protein E0L32_001524 [Thyridium curvatum]XP_030990925.1 uncharacterized protein E0L32_001674 [Thyridium curvatum]TPX09064.1 hypothetical protein E0L32_001524 [Thyridium curvatum]TPX09214.1 hypothetical protein E0L32_001674 [Thyridium curvatum]